jgi:uncharacterized membrane protein required for colicin V production
MTTVDWIIVGLAAVLAVNGLRQGFIVGALQLVGFAAGAFAGSRVGPLVLSDGAHSPYAPLCALGGAVLLGSLCAGGLEMAGLALRRLVPLPGFRLVDGGLGAILGAALALGLAWVVGAVALQTPGLDLRGDIQRSKILAELNRDLPPSGFLLNALARFDALPQVRGPGAEGVAPPTPQIARSGKVKAAAASVVRVLGTACGLGVEGSGWVAGPGVVVTNAHVVAGEQDTIVQPQGIGPRLDARVVLFDPTNDIAVLRVSALGAPPLPLAVSPAEGRAAAILGFPHNGPYTVRAARLGPTREVLTEDAYGRGPVKRLVVTFRGHVESGNSGGPLVDGDGQVVATVFALAVGSGPPSGYGVPDSVVRHALADAGTGAVGTGPCSG